MSIDETTRRFLDMVGSYVELVDQSYAAAIRRRLERWPLTTADLGAASKETYKITRGKVCDYSRDGVDVDVALRYGFWQINTIVGALGSPLLATDGPLRIVDFGAGTGTAAVAVGLQAAALERLGLCRNLEVQVVCVEPAEPMRRLGELITWEVLERLGLDNVEVLWGRPGEAEMVVDSLPTTLTAFHVLDPAESGPEWADRLNGVAHDVGAERMVLASQGRRLLQEVQDWLRGERSGLDVWDLDGREDFWELLPNAFEEDPFGAEALPKSRRLADDTYRDVPVKRPFPTFKAGAGWKPHVSRLRRRQPASGT